MNIINSLDQCRVEHTPVGVARRPNGPDLHVHLTDMIKLIIHNNIIIPGF